MQLKDITSGIAKVFSPDTKVLNQLKITQKQLNDSYDSLDRMISAEQGNGVSYDAMLHNMQKMGDPYMENAWIRACTDLISSSVASLDFEFTDNQGKVLPDTHKIVKLFDYVDRGEDRSSFLSDIVTGLMRFGKAFILLNDSKNVILNKLPERFSVLIPDRVVAQQYLGKLQYWKYSPGVAGAVSQLGGDRTAYEIYQPDQLLFIKYKKHPYLPYETLGPVSSVYLEYMLFFYAQAYNINLMQSGAQGKGAWKRKSGGAAMTAEQTKLLDAAMNNKFNQGVAGAGKNVFVNQDVDWVRTSMDNKDLEYNKMLDTASDIICVGMRTPKILVAPGKDATFVNLQEAKKIFWTTTCIPIAKIIQNCFNSNFFDEYDLDVKMRFKFEKIPELRDDVKVQADSYKTLVQGGMPPAVASEMLGLPLPRDDQGKLIGWVNWELPVSTQGAANTAPVPEEKKPIDPISIPEPKKELNKEILYKEFLQRQKKEEILKINKDPIAQKEFARKHVQYILEDERKVKNIVKAYFKEYWKQIEKHLKETGLKTLDNIVTKDLIDPHVIEQVKTFIRGLSFDNRALFNQLGPQIQDTFFEGAYKLYDSLGIADSFQRRDSLAAGFLNDRKALLQDIPGDLKQNLITYLDSEEMQGKNFISKLSRHFDDQVEYRAKRVAQTESTAAYNAGTQGTMEDLKAAGMLSRKQWIYVHDDKVRDSHMLEPELGEGIVGVDESFGNGLLYPGDSSGGPEEVINCRCTMVAYFEPGESSDLSNSTFIV